MTTTTLRNKNNIASPTPEQARFAFIILLIINILNYTDRSVLSSVLPSIKTEFGISDIDLGLLSSSFLFIYGIATLPLGIWADRGMRKNIIALCVTIWSIATTLGGLTHNFIQLFLTRGVLGIGEAGYAPASLSMIGDYFPRETRGRMLSIWSIGNLIGTALGLLIGGHVADALGWRWVFYIVGIPGLLTAFIIWRAVEPKRGAFDNAGGASNEASTGHGSLGKGLWGVVKRLTHTPTYWILIVTFICSFFIIGAALTWVPTFLTRTFALKLSQASTIASGVLGGGSLVGTLLGGYLADFLQQKRPEGRMIVTAIAFLVGAPLTWLALSLHNLPLFIAIFIVAITCLSMCLGPIQAIIQDITAPDIRSTAVGLALLLAHLLGDAASPIIVGAISDQAHSIGFALLVTGPTCLFLAGIVSLFGLRTVASDMRKMQEQLHKQ